MTGRTNHQLRRATLDDVAQISALIAESARGLSRGDYSNAQIEAALGSAWGVDTQLIRDGTFFVVEADGSSARRGLGTLLLQHCEAEARARGFRRVALAATLPGQRFYRSMGYVAGTAVDYSGRDGVTIPFVPMQKALT